jgi:uncharacterized protein
MALLFHLKKGIYRVMRDAMAIFMGICVLSCHSDKSSSSHSGNHLSSASSPYLLEHADNPVNWHEWGEEALEKAKQENKPLIISIGYAACHWCHVMEEETFMDTAVAKYMNAYFVAIKVDREERPDLDEIYMNAAQLINGEGGWPLNAFAMPDGKPFYAGTYFSTEGWLKLLKNIHQAYTSDKARLSKQSEDLTREIKTIQTAVGNTDSIAGQDRALYGSVFRKLRDQVDYENGGFRGAPKFPLPVRWEFMLQYAFLNKDKAALNATTTFLDKLAAGGIYDQLGGGFSRYATDDQWHVPHFEKMLYDNAQLVSLYAHAYQYTRNENYGQIIRETLAFVKRDLTDPEGGFYSSLNADSEGKEGKFYVWKYDEIARLLTPRELTAFEKNYAISKKGNWEEGENILFRNSSTQVSADDSLAAGARHKLLVARSRRVPPSLDDKILTSWNALMLKAYVDAHLALGDPAYLREALRSAGFLKKYVLSKENVLSRNFRAKKASINGFLEDYAFLSDAMISLYQATFDKQWLDMALALVEKTDARFYDSQSGFYTISAVKNKNILVNGIVTNDGVLPSANAVMALTKYKLGQLLYKEEYITHARKMLEKMKPGLAEDEASYAKWAFLLGWEHFGTYEVAILGEKALLHNRLMQKEYLPNALFGGGVAENLPLLESKSVDGETRIYVCRDKVCKLPTTDPSHALKMMRLTPDY